MTSVPSHPVLTCAEAKVWEARCLKDEAAEWDAMQRAGAAVARAVEEDFKEIGGLPVRARLLVLVGKGHNGGDALLAAQAILPRYPQSTAEILLCFGEPALRPLARRSLDELLRAAGPRARVRSVVEFGASARAELLGQNFDLCMDGIFGFQFRSPMDQATVGMIAWVNQHPRIRLRAAVDLPSGVGRVSAPTVYRADFTYATGIVKSPLLLSANIAAVGRLRYLDLGFFEAQHGEPNAPDRVLLPSILGPLTELRSPQSDKRTFGHLCVVGGSASYPGAVVLAVRAALRSGVGLITAFVPERFAPEYAVSHPEIMWVGCPQNSAGGLSSDCLPALRERLKRASALLVGPGLGADPETIELVRRIAAEVKVPILLDADALRPEVVHELGKKSFICTPHAGEFKRIAGKLGLREFCKKQGGVIVLKGPMTQVCSGAPASVKANRALKHRVTSPAIYCSLFGGPVLARGGSGDMLAGLIGGLLAQKPDDPLLAASRGVVWHGLAADLLARAHGQVAVENSQLLEQLGPALHHTHG